MNNSSVLICALNKDLNSSRSQLLGQCGRSKFILAEGVLQNQDGVVHIKASHLRSLSDQTLEVRSHDFH